MQYFYVIPSVRHTFCYHCSNAEIYSKLQAVSAYCLFMLIMITYLMTRIVVCKMWTFRKKFMNKNILLPGLILFVIAIFCDRILFPKLFPNVVHSRYFSLQGHDKQLDSLFLARNRNCALKAISYWKSRERPTNFESHNLNIVDKSVVDFS